MKGTLYLVPVHIGNPEDMTLRALRVLRSAPIIICESFKEARRLLAPLNIPAELRELNEHNERDAAQELCALLSSGQDAALISDCGTPVFSDPGLTLVRLCRQNGIPVVPLPGANSIIPALAASGFSLDSFYYRGWLSPKTGVRRKELFELRGRKELIVLMETPYRLTRLLKDIADFFPPATPCALAYELTAEKEKFYFGTPHELLSLATKLSLKGEFVLMLDHRQNRR